MKSLTFLILMALFTGCTASFSGTSDNTEKALLTIAVSKPPEILSAPQSYEPGTPRTALPADNMITTIYIKGSGPQGMTIEKTSTLSTVSLELSPGIWSFQAEGRSANGLTLAVGSLTVQVKSGERLQANLALLPLSGAGRLNISWAIQGDLGPDAIVHYNLKGPQDYNNSFTASATASRIDPIELSAGSYILTATISANGIDLCGLAESILILANQETTLHLSFAPPLATVQSTISVPIILGPPVELLPRTRYVSVNTLPLFALYPATIIQKSSWYLEGIVIPTGPFVHTDHIQVQNLPPNSGRYRLDWIGNTGALSDGSATATIVQKDGPSVEPIGWAEKIYAEDLGSNKASLALENCKDMAINDGSATLALISKDKNSLGIFSYSGPGTLMPLGSFSSSQDAMFQGPIRLRFIPETNELLVLCETSGNLFKFQVDEQSHQPSLLQVFHSELLVGASNLVLLGSRWALITVPDNNRVYRLDITTMQTDTLEEWASPAQPGLESLSRPSSMAVNATHQELVIGTLGDDALYFFAYNEINGSGSLQYKLTKEAVSPITNLSDPIDLQFTPDGASLFALSYYGRALLELDRDPLTGTYTPVNALKSGSGGVMGFNYPQRLAIAAEKNLLFISANGTGDGISVVQYAPGSPLNWLGYFPVVDEPFGLAKPTALLWDAASQSCIAGSGLEKSLLILK